MYFPRPYGAGTGSAITDGRSGQSSRTSLSSMYGDCSVTGSSCITGANAALIARCIVGVARKLAVQRQPDGAAGLELIAHVAIDADVGAAEAIDRLLRIADDEQRAGPDLAVRQSGFDRSRLDSSAASSTSSSA